MDQDEIEERILSARQVWELIGVSRTTVWRWERSGLFPRRRVLGKNRIGWLAREIFEWIRTRPVAKA